MNNRIALLMKEEGLTSSRLAEILDVQASSISHILSGRNKPSFDFIEKLILRFPSVNPDWLITGIGEIYRPNQSFTSIAPTPRHMDAQQQPDANLRQEVLPFEKTPVDRTITAQEPREVAKTSNLNEIFDQEDIERIIIFYKNKKFVSYKP